MSIDAMGCKRDIAKQIVDQGGDYVLGLKGNQGTLHEAVEDYLTTAQAAGFKQIKYDYVEEVEHGHGRLETRRYWITDDLRTLPKTESWAGLRTIGMVEREYEEAGKQFKEKRFFSSTLFRLLLKPLPIRRGGTGGLRIACIGGWMPYFEKMPVVNAFALYLVVSRERSRQFNADAAVSLETATQETVRCQKVVAEDGQEVRLYCHSPGREQKEQAMAERFASQFESELNAINEGLQCPRTEKHPDKLWERIGRLKEKHHGIGQHYQIDLQTDDSGEKALSITWQKQIAQGSYVDLQGVYCLRSNQTQWPEEQLIVR